HLAHLGHGAVDLRVGAEAAQAEAQRALRQPRIAPQRPQHVGGLAGGRIARRAGGEREPVQGAAEAPPLDALEGDVLDARYAGGLRAIAMHAAEAREALPQALTELAQTTRFRRLRLARQLAGRAEAGDLVHGERAGAQRALLAAAEAHRLQPVAGA